MATNAMQQGSALPVTSLKAAEDSSRTPMQLAVRNFRKNKLAVGGLGLVLFVVAIAVLADLLSPIPFKYQSADTQDAPPGHLEVVKNDDGSTYQFTNWLGSDDLGRDVFTRLLHGSRVSLAVGIVSELVVVLIGVPLGLAAGYFGGRVDNLIMRFTDIMYAFPDLLLVIIITATFGRSLWVIFIALGVASWVTMARLVRGQVLQVKQMDYVLGARSIGARPVGLMARHILPNILGPIIVVVTLGIPGAIIAEATLTFLGLGVDPSTPTWGTMVDAARPGIYSRPGEVLIPALAIAALALAFTFVGDGVRDALDPRSK